jgi:hypothetical protein
MCRRPYAPEDVKLELHLAFCGVCHVVRDLPPNTEALLSGAATDPVPSTPRPPLARPEGFVVHEIPGALVVRWKASPMTPLVSLVFVVAAPLLPVFAPPGASLLHIYGILSPFLVGLTYVLIAALANVSRLEVRRDRLVFTHGPLPIPWRWGSSVDVGAIDQLYCHRYSASRNRTLYELVARRKDRAATVCLVDGFDRPEPVIFLEQQVERRLGIEDVEVKAEVKRPGP